MTQIFQGVIFSCCGLLYVFLIIGQNDKMISNCKNKFASFSISVVTQNTTTKTSKQMTKTSQLSGLEKFLFHKENRKVKMQAILQVAGRMFFTQSSETLAYDHVAMILPKAHRPQLEALGLISPRKIPRL